ncbi:hypothetical protein [Pseudomonas haemolytica]|uniref:hypothetical protein n=1 Tax=Pseudomonas haemolytica TaxID=2600065 RepID=UPI00190E2265|nr:hypothetical protein [Pseudomonas haemolytica]MBK3451034.1 hypothetical protein [Pseudomonas haemolytica]
MYHYYKPLRNFSKKLDLNTSLVQVWQIFQNIVNDKPLPYEFHVLGNGSPSVKGKAFPWELDILVKEIILHAGTVCDKNLFVIPDFVCAFNLAKNIPDALIGMRPQERIMREMSRIYSQQSTWKTGKDLQTLARYLRIYSYPDLHEVLLKATGMSIKHHMLMGAAITGHLLGSYWYSPLQSFEVFGISNQMRDSFWNRVSSNVNDLREAVRKEQKYDDDWAYTFNPLMEKPFIRGLTRDPNMAVCPIPSYLLQRITEGLFFDIKSINGFGNSYGAAFEHYVKGITEQLSGERGFKIIEGAEYKIGKDKKHGVDLILEGKDIAILIECKTKKMVWDARYGYGEESLISEIEKLAKFVVQNYKNLIDVVNGNANWKCLGRNLYPMVVTLGDFVMMDPVIIARFESEILDKLSIEGLPHEIQFEYPYLVVSIEEYEKLIQILDLVGFEEFFGKFKASNSKGWEVTRFLHEVYSVEISTRMNDYLRQDLLDLKTDQVFYERDRPATK